MARRLARTVHVRDEHRVPHVFGPADDVPSWAQDKISNPAAWADGAALPTAPPARATPSSEPRIETQAPTTGMWVDPPPQAGRGSSTAAWRAYAEHHGVQAAPDADRGDIIDAVRTAGVPVE